MQLKFNAPKKFDEEKIAPSLENQFRPTILTYSADHW